MKKKVYQKKTKPSVPLFKIIFLILALILVSIYIFVHFNIATPNKIQAGNSDLFQTHAPAATVVVSSVPADNIDNENTGIAPQSTVTPTSSDASVSVVMTSIPAFVVPATSSDADIASATPNEPITTVTPSEKEKDLLQVYFLSVGRNDGILIRMGDECAFIDGGKESSARSALQYISEELGIKKLKYYIATHGHEDHVGCGGLVLSTFETETILHNSDLSIQTMKESTDNRDFRELIDHTDKQLFLLNDTVMIGDALLTCVGPEKVVPRRDKKDGTENENSIIIRLTYGNRSFLLTGDATTKNFLEMLECRPEAAVCDVIKGAHHDNPINKDFLNATNAKYYVYSTGDDFPPEDWDINKVRETGARVFVTNNNNAGSTLFTTDGEFLEVQTEHTVPDWEIERSNILKMAVGNVVRCPYNPGRRIIDTVHWTTSDDSLVKIEYDYGRVKIHALAPGKCTITATHFDGSTREIAVEIKKK